MAKTREIRKRIKAVANIQRITKTMQMIATSKFARAQNRATATKPYTEGVFELVTELAATAGDLRHPLIDGPSGGAKKDAGEVLLVLSSDRGLCGPYNGSVVRSAMQHFRSRQSPPAIEVSGRKGLGYFKFNNIPVEAHHAEFGDKPEYEDVERLAERYMERFINGEVTAVHVAYMQFITAGRQVPEVRQLLPLKPPASPTAEQSSGPGLLYEFSPSADELLDELLPATIRATLFQCFNDAVVSEHVARMVAMKAATDNAGKMRKGLNRTFNRARQAQITTELTEIIGGAAALG